MTIADGITMLDFIWHQRKLRRGQLERVPHGVRQLTAQRSVELRLVGVGAGCGGAAGLPVEADGELVGSAPLRIDLLPRALPFVCPRA